MPNWVQVCPVEPVNGVCPESLVWVHGYVQEVLTFDQFLIMLPAIVTGLFAAYGFKLILRMFFKR